MKEMENNNLSKTIGSTKSPDIYPLKKETTAENQSKTGILQVLQEPAKTGLQIII